MNLILSFISICALLTFVVVLVQSIELHLIRLSINDIQEFIQNIEIADEHAKDLTPMLSSAELQRLEEKENFEQRIERMKEELAQKNNIIKTGTQAVEFHPGVHNLPHDIIPTKQDTLPDVEYTQ